MPELRVYREIAVSKPCKVCGEPIKNGARKCIHCESFQDWRSAFSAGNTFLSLLIALISVVSLTLPGWVTWFDKKDSDIAVYYQGTGRGYISVMVSNMGTRPGTVSNLILTQAVGEKGRSALFLLHSRMFYRVIEPGRSELVTFYRSHSFDRSTDDQKSSGPVYFIVGSTSFKGKPNRIGPIRVTGFMDECHFSCNESFVPEK